LASLSLGVLFCPHGSASVLLDVPVLTGHLEKDAQGVAIGKYRIPPAAISFFNLLITLSFVKSY
jgi:hypothetical protein